MSHGIEILPGFPLTLDDYSPLVDELSRRGHTPMAIRIAHSLGSLRALAEPSDLPTVLLAPSIPGRRRGRSAIRAALLLAARSPLSRTLASELRRSSYRRFGATPPLGEALTLEEAADRLRPVRVVEPPVVSPVAILGSRTDPRSAAQRELAQRLGVPFHWVDGGHLFPITQPVETADAILQALGA